MSNDLRCWMRLIEGNDSRKDASDEDDRVFDAYLKKNRIDWRDQRSQEEWDRLRADALANRDRYPVPISDAAFLYHGTSKARLPLIARQGLLPSEKSRWNKDVGIGDWSLDKIFFTDTISSATFYAKEASKTRPVILRVARKKLDGAKSDFKDKDGSVYVVHRVPPDDIQFWNGRKWAPLKRP